MKKIEEKEIMDAAEYLAGMVRYNDEVLKPEDRIVHTATVVTGDNRMIAVLGSAHELKPLFGELLRRRPELRQVMESSLEENFKRG